MQLRTWGEKIPTAYQSAVHGEISNKLTYVSSNSSPPWTRKQFRAFNASVGVSATTGACHPMESDPFFDTRNLGSTPKIEGFRRIWSPHFYRRSVRIINVWEFSPLSTNLAHSLPRVERRRLSRGISEIHAHWLAGHISTFPEQCVQPCWKRPHRDPSAWKAIRHFQERYILVDSLAHQSRPTTFFSL